MRQKLTMMNLKRILKKLKNKTKANQCGVPGVRSA
jgi:hypothetical protein